MNRSLCQMPRRCWSSTPSPTLSQTSRTSSRRAAGPTQLRGPMISMKTGWSCNIVYFCLFTFLFEGLKVWKFQNVFCNFGLYFPAAATEHLYPKFTEIYAWLFVTKLIFVFSYFLLFTFIFGHHWEFVFAAENCPGWNLLGCPQSPRAPWRNLITVGGETASILVTVPFTFSS